ncbi:hypothetical protein DN752_05905 [Echinicola strongylocentroti]|uniref:NRDE family protein n=1 Tax=Echinicola strongylocentroti TaxID=1795355 RepID=A0A2Z4IGY7_9BACT|nr:NRDE family protein [Echinicola strongylocentroti]AWW29693.1 hypothetical protein DN752_05905 [Echinicola strongylocentroti]
MCTVTYIPLPSGFVLSSNRDELTHRAALPPMWHSPGAAPLLFPYEPTSKGSWLAVSKQLEVRCLLNGAFENHIKKPNYRKSRGKMLVESFNSPALEAFVNEYNFDGIAPFTLIDINETGLSEIRWDEKKITVNKLPSDQAKIWSSATLYPPPVRKERESAFTQWLHKNRASEDVNITDFHLSTHGMDATNDILMARPSGIKTTSFTQFRKQGNHGSLTFRDLEKATISTTQWKSNNLSTVH